MTTDFNHRKKVPSKMLIIEVHLHSFYILFKGNILLLHRQMSALHEYFFISALL